MQQIEHVSDEFAEEFERVIAEEVGAEGDGTYFKVYISRLHDTSKHLTNWEVDIKHDSSSWKGRITSNNPEEFLEAPLPGNFTVRAIGSGPKIRRGEIYCVPRSINCPKF